MTSSIARLDDNCQRASLDLPIDKIAEVRDGRSLARWIDQILANGLDGAVYINRRASRIEYEGVLVATIV